MKTSTSILAIAEALAAAQAEIQNPIMNREVTVRPREGAPYSFSYATLDGILDGVRPILAKNGIAIVQTLDTSGERIAMETMLLHKSGEFLATSMPMTVDRPGNQAFGSACTYARRYAILGMLCLAADPDEDGNAADGNEVHGVRDRPVQRQAAPPRDAQATGQRAAAAAAAGAPQPSQDAQPSQAAQPSQKALSPEAQDARARMDKATASLVAKVGQDEAAHQVAAVKKKHGADWRKTLAAVEALDQSIPAGK